MTSQGGGHRWARGSGFRACGGGVALGLGVVLSGGAPVTPYGAISQEDSKVEEVVIRPADLLDGTHERLHGETRYQLVEVDGRTAIRARCEASASGLWVEVSVDLHETPVIEWDWRVDETYPDTIDETVRSGDDFPARVYVVDESRLFWRTRAMNYVWASSQPKGADWPNAYQRRVRMLAVRSGPPPGPGEWSRERRNIRADFADLHDEAVDRIDGVGIMTDCDDLGTQGEAWYGTIRFRAEGEG